ncbi:deoxycytidylate deaminase [Ramlibacter albus]|uniref:dCMP deaminase family protein n=1 Tax=Ramlibacter albus TaxID=2079448 RepID=A0A923M9A6_9BURK|nr:dCMP deaminase family protein [Ramlibacter albus]MBC5765268.1 dCMP deaminase family protein [Ramlibacter albus]
MSTDANRPKALIGWHEMFMGVALLASARSKDHRARNGASIVSPDQRILGVGYNGLPRGCDDGDPVYWSDNDEDPFHSRHSYVVHAEINAILNCVVHPLREATIYTTQFPCPRCAQAIIQAGIRNVVYLREKKHHAAENQAALKMFAASGVKCESMEAFDPGAYGWSRDLAGALQLAPMSRGENDV